MSTLSPDLTRTAPVQEVFSSIQGEGVYVGKRQIFVRFAHCHLKCAYCDTPMTSEDGQCHVETEPGQGHSLVVPNPLNSISLLDILLPILSKAKHHSISFTGGEPLLYHGFLKELFPKLQPHCKTYLETSGTQPEFLAEILPWTDIIAMDIKLPSTTKEVPRFSEHAAFYQLAKKPELFIKLVFNDATTDAELEAVRQIVTDRDTPIILQPETSLTDNSVKINARRLWEIEQCLSQSFTDIRVIPQTHKMLQVL